jgi:hypothetical protein
MFTNLTYNNMTDLTGTGLATVLAPVGEIIVFSLINTCLSLYLVSFTFTLLSVLYYNF